MFYDLFLFLHLIGAITIFAGIAVAGVSLETARRRSDTREIYSILSLSRAGALMVAIGTIMAGVLGLLLVDLGHWGYQTLWVELATGLFVVALALGYLGGQAPKRARLLAGALEPNSAGTEPSARLSRLLNSRLARLCNYASLILMVAILYLMVFKPGS